MPLKYPELSHRFYRWPKCSFEKKIIHFSNFKIHFFRRKWEGSCNQNYQNSKRNEYTYQALSSAAAIAEAIGEAVINRRNSDANRSVNNVTHCKKTVAKLTA